MATTLSVLTNTCPIHFFRWWQNFCRTSWFAKLQDFDMQVNSSWEPYELPSPEGWLPRFSPSLLSLWSPCLPPSQFLFFCHSNSCWTLMGSLTLRQIYLLYPGEIWSTIDVWNGCLMSLQETNIHSSLARLGTSANSVRRSESRVATTSDILGQWETGGLCVEEKSQTLQSLSRDWGICFHVYQKTIVLQTLHSPLNILLHLIPNGEVDQ